MRVSAPAADDSIAGLARRSSGLDHPELARARLVKASVLAAPVVGLRYTISVPDEVRELLLTEVALDKLGARRIGTHDVAQVPNNAHVVVRNPRGGDPGTRRLLIGRTDGARCLTLVIEQTIDHTTWLIITGWDSTEVERKLVGA